MVADDGSVQQNCTACLNTMDFDRSNCPCMPGMCHIQRCFDMVGVLDDLA